MPKGNEGEGALDDFSNDFPTEESLQEANPDFLTPTEEQPTQVETTHGKEDDEEGRKNRQHRRTSMRLEAEKKALQEIREKNIAEAARLEVLSEQRKFMDGLPSKGIDERLITLYGDDDAGKKAAQITQSLLEDTAKRAREQALEDFQKVSREREEEIKANNEFIDSQLEEIEDESGMDLTSNSPVGRKNRAEFLDMVTKFSSKDGDGYVQEYADFNEVFNVFKQTRKSGTNTQNKNLASRGMARGGSNQQMVGNKATEAALRNMGII